MPPAAEYTEELIYASIASALGAIEAGADYWYEPLVVRSDTYSNVLGTEDPITYIIRDTSELVRAPALREFGKDCAEITIFILLAFHDKRAETNPKAMSAPTRGTIRNRMVGDVTKKLNEDMSRGGLAINQDIGDPNKDFEEGPSGWILAELPVSITIVSPYDAP